MDLVLLPRIVGSHARKLRFRKHIRGYKIYQYLLEEGKHFIELTVDSIIMISFIKYVHLGDIKCVCTRAVCTVINLSLIHISIPVMNYCKKQHINDNKYVQ